MQVFKFTDSKGQLMGYADPSSVIEWVSGDLELAKVGDSFNYKVEVIEMSEEEYDKLAEFDE